MNNKPIAPKAETVKNKLAELKKATDGELASMFRMGDNAALTEIVNRYQATTMRTLLIETKDYDAACNIWQDVVIKIANYIKSDKYKEQGKLAGLISLSAHNKFNDYYRTKKAKKENLMEEGSLAFSLIDSGANEAIEREEKLNFIYKEVEELPENQKEVFLMIQNGYKNREVAEKLGISINTVLSRYSYAVKKLRAAAANF